MTPEQSKALVLNAYAAFDQGDVDRGRELVAPDITGCIMGGVQIAGADAFFEYALSIQAAFPDGYHVFEEVIVEADKVVTRGVFRGTHGGALMGIAPSGKTVEFSVIHIDRVQNGKIIEHWGQADVLSLLRQLGAMPAGAGLA